MSDVWFATIVLDIASYVLKELASIGLTKLKEKILNPTSDESTAKVEIKESEIREKIEETLLKRNDIDEIKNNHDKMTELIEKVLSEVKILSTGDPELQVASDQIVISQQGQVKDEELDSTLTDRLKRIEKRLDEIAATRLAEPIAKSKQPVQNENPALPGETQEAKKSKDQSSKKPGLENPKSQEMLENLHKYKEFGESVLQVVKSLEPYKSSTNQTLDNPKLKDCLKSLKDAAENTVKLASSPVKIAVMGEISSGKTLLIGNLIGYADGLPVSEIPTTGNVTAIHLLQQEELKTTEFDNFIVEYLSHAEVKECLEFMLEKAKELAQTSELPSLPQLDLETLDKDTPNPYEDWCKKAWKQIKNRELHYLLRELIIFIRTYVDYGADLCGQSLKITHATACEGLKLTSKSVVTQDTKFEEIPSISKVTVNKNGPSAELLQNSFSLIRRVNINVTISKEIWNLGTTQDAAKFILLDFPGLGAADSGVRDTFVSLQELEKVQTILILLNGNSPGSDRANKIFTMIEQKRRNQPLKDFILVGVGRFNQLSIGSEKKIDELIKSTANNSLTETTVFKQFSGLKTIIDQASALTSQKDRIVFLDQLIGLADLGKNSGAVKVGSQQFVARFEDQNDIYLQQSKQMCDKWQSLSKVLLKTDPDSSLGKQLCDFAEEGGIPKLRELILNHVAEHSLKQLYEDTRKDADKLRQQQNQLKDILSDLGIKTEESQALIDLRSYLVNMKSTYNLMRDNLGKEPLKDAKGVTISDVIKDEVTYKILEWSEWHLLFNNSQDGIIIVSQEEEDEDDEPRRRRRRTKSNIPTKSDDFYRVFERTVKELQTLARERIEQAIINFLQKLSGELDQEIQYFDENLNETIEQNVRDKFGDEDDVEEVEILGVFSDTYDPKKWQKFIINKIFKEDKALDANAVFPLAQKDEKHGKGQFFDWASESSKIKNQTPNQILLVQRLRDEITANISLHLIEYVAKINKKVDQAILNELKYLTSTLDDLLKKEALLRLMTGEKQENKEADPVSPILSKIASISFPDISN